MVIARAVGEWAAKGRSPFNNIVTAKLLFASLMCKKVIITTKVDWPNASGQGSSCWHLFPMDFASSLCG